MKKIFVNIFLCMLFISCEQPLSIETVTIDPDGGDVSSLTATIKVSGREGTLRVDWNHAAYGINSLVKSGQPSLEWDASYKSTLDGVTDGWYWVDVYDSAENVLLGQSDSVFCGTKSSIIPVADFRCFPESGEAPINITYVDYSEGDIEHWTWDYGDGIKYEFDTPTQSTALFTFAGVYTPSLIVSCLAGVDTVIKKDYIHITAP